MNWRNGLIIITIMLILQLAMAESPHVVFIINVENHTQKISEAQLRDFYFKRKRYWSNGESVRFMDHTIGPLRESFLKKYIGQSSAEVEIFWIKKKLDSGDSAPLKVSSDDTTMNFVGSLRGAIGYVSDTTVLRKNVKVLKIDGVGE